LLAAIAVVLTNGTGLTGDRLSGAAARCGGSTVCPLARQTKRSVSVAVFFDIDA